MEVGVCESGAEGEGGGAGFSQYSDHPQLPAQPLPTTPPVSQHTLLSVNHKCSDILLLYGSLLCSLSVNRSIEIIESLLLCDLTVGHHKK